MSWVYCRSGVDKDAVTARKANDDLHFCAFDAAFTVLSQRSNVCNKSSCDDHLHERRTVFSSQATALCGSAQLTDFELRSLRFVSILASPGLDRASKEVLSFEFGRMVHYVSDHELEISVQMHPASCGTASVAGLDTNISWVTSVVSGDTSHFSQCWQVSCVPSAVTGSPSDNRVLLLFSFTPTIIWSVGVCFVLALHCCDDGFGVIVLLQADCAIWVAPPAIIIYSYVSFTNGTMI